MKSQKFLRCLLAISFCLAFMPVAIGATDWPQFRGPTGDGRSPAKNVPIEWSAENMTRLGAALRDLDAKLFGVDAELLDVDPLNPDDLLNGGNFTLRTAAGGLDLFDPDQIPGGRPFEEMRPRGVEAIVDGIRIRAVGFDDLLRLKRESGRDRDLEDVATLLAAKRL